MRRQILLLLLILAVSLECQASKIISENVELELGDHADATVELHYELLTSEKISYVVPYKVYNVEGFYANRKLDCQIRDQKVGSQILCGIDVKNNFSVTLKYSTRAMIFYDGRVYNFLYTHSILEPTGIYKVRVILPEGTGILRSEISNFPTIQPDYKTIGSISGRKIFVEWENRNVKLGETLQYRVYYEKLTTISPFYTETYFWGILLLAIVLIFIFYVWKNRESTISRIMPILMDDERKILEYLASQNNECKQRNVVRNVPFSKAKVSRIITDLCARGILHKERRGRTNIIRLVKEIKDIKTKAKEET